MFALGRTRTNFGVLHLLSAASLSREVGESERNHHGKPFGDFWEGEILAKVIVHSLILTALMGVVAMLQAYVVPWMVPRL